MTTPAARDYKKLGLMCGLEVHQQLAGSKLFCHCSAEITTDRDFAVKRFLRLSQSELGETDVSARAEVAKKNQFLYTGSVRHSCLVDIDESPPLALSAQALTTALQISKLLKANPVDAIAVMRKIVVDGSNTAGFQRTALIALNGSLISSLGPIGIPTINIEEDSAQKISSGNGVVEYNIDRLGIPLVEIGTTPDIQSPDHCAEVAQEIGQLLRSTGAVRRGLGSIRQDINVSIRGGARVEIKGAQDLRLIPTIVDQEVTRQEQLIYLKGEFARRKVVIDAPVSITGVLKLSQSKVIGGALAKEHGCVWGLRLVNAKGLLGHEIQLKRRLGTELSNYAKVHAGIGGLFHSDELPNYGVTPEEVIKIREALLCKNDDGFLLVADAEPKVRQAMQVIKDRLALVQVEIPKEVRMALDSGASEYMRPLPGAGRMYPETDLPLLPLSKEFVQSIAIPETISSRIARYEKDGLSKDLAALAAKSDEWQSIDRLMAKFSSLKAGFIAETMLTAQKVVKTQFGVDCNPSEEDYLALFGALAAEKISKESIPEILSQNVAVKSIISKFFMLSDTQIREEISKILTAHKDAPLASLRGEVMKVLRGKAAGKRIMELLDELMKKAIKPGK